MAKSWPSQVYLNVSADKMCAVAVNFFHALFVDPSKRISWDVVREIIHQKRLSFNFESRGNEEKGKALLPIPLKVTLVFTNRIGRSNLSRGWASWWPRVHTRKLLGLQFACVSIKMQVAAVFLPQGKVSPRAGRPKSRNCRPCTSRRVSTPASCPKHDMLSFRVSRSHAVGTFRLSAVLNTLP